MSQTVRRLVNAEQTPASNLSQKTGQMRRTLSSYKAKSAESVEGIRLRTASGSLRRRRETAGAVSVVISQECFPRRSRRDRASI